MKSTVDLRTIIWNSLNLTDSTCNLIEAYEDMLKDLWRNVDGVKSIDTSEILEKQIHIIVDEEKYDEVYASIKEMGWTVHKGQNDWSNHLFILWGDCP